MKHTKGEWKVMPGSSAPRVCVDGDKDWPIVIKISGHSDEGIKANEHLISAAPEMLEAIIQALLMYPQELRGSNLEAAACKAIQEDFHCCGGNDDYQQVHNMDCVEWKRRMAKARGES